MQARQRKLFVAAQLVAAALLIYFIGSDLAKQWRDVRAEPLETNVNALALTVSAAIVLATYGLLIQVWRILLAGAGGRGGTSLPFWRAARIWSISNLWRYVPGKIWQIGAMSALAQRERVSPVAAAGAAILSTVLNIATGLALVMLLSWRFLGEWNARAQPLAVALLVAAVVGLVALPYVLPRLSTVAGRVIGRDASISAPPRWAIAIATGGNVLSWVLYGMAFLWLVRGLIGDAGGAPWHYIAVFTASYVVGYLFLLIPGGIGPREAVMLWMLATLSLMTDKQAALVTVASRLWLTLLELVPGLLFLAIDRIRPPPPRPSDSRTDVGSTR
ncbi:MAG: lysylphosphatidylglycerol synthase domain-containing protein [Gemmatimonadaceae bacterium]